MRRLVNVDTTGNTSPLLISGAPTAMFNSAILASALDSALRMPPPPFCGRCTQSTPTRCARIIISRCGPVSAPGLA